MSTWRRAAVPLAVLILLVAACGRDEGGAAGEGGAATTQAAAIEEGPATGTISVWAMGTEGDNLGVLADAFKEENPDATVEATAVPWDAAHDRISTALAGQQTPDSSLIGTTWMGEFASTGGLDPTPENIDPSAFFEGAWNTAVVDGVSYGIPWYVETRLLYYRTDLAEQAGFDAPPANWDELKQLAQGMEEQGGAEHAISLQPGGTGAWQTFMPFVWQAGGDILDESGNFVLDAEPNVAALDYYRSFFEDGLSPETLEAGALEQGFADGTIGMFISGPWMIGIIQDAGAEEGTWDVALLPEGEASRTSFVGGGDMAVFTDAPNRETAWKFVEFVSRPETQLLWYETVNDLPSVQAAWDDPALAEDERLARFGEQLQEAKSPPAIATWEQIANVIDTQLEQAILGGVSSADAVAAMQQEATTIGTGQ
jgi:multiple sugar transport system substrate-binding protein